MRLIDADALKAYVNSLSTHPLNEWDTWGVLAAIDKQPTVPAAPRWVRCEDELPIKGEIVIVSDGKHTWDIGQYRCLAFSDDRTKWWWKGHTIKTVKWWMRKKDAIPEPPKEGE